MPDKKRSTEHDRMARELRNARAWIKARSSQQAVADRLGLSAGQVSKLVNGGNPMTVWHLAQIADLLEISIPTLLGQHPLETPRLQRQNEIVDQENKLAWMRLFDQMEREERNFALRLVRQGFGRSNAA